MKIFNRSPFAWPFTSGKMLIKKHIRDSKHDPLVEEVELLDANPSYAHVRFVSQTVIERDNSTVDRHIQDTNTFKS